MLPTVSRIGRTKLRPVSVVKNWSGCDQIDDTEFQTNTVAKVARINSSRTFAFAYSGFVAAKASVAAKKKRIGTKTNSVTRLKV